MADPVTNRLNRENELAADESGMAVDDDRTRAVAEYLSDMVAQLETMARLAGLDLLSYLLSMARVEAETNARTIGAKRANSNYPR